MKRDPASDPRPGDVFRGARTERRVTLRDGYIVAYRTRSLATGKERPRESVVRRTAFARWAKNAEVVKWR